MIHFLIFITLVSLKNECVGYLYIYILTYEMKKMFHATSANISFEYINKNIIPI